MSNYLFLADLVEKLVGTLKYDRNHIQILDIGCGDCQLLSELRSRNKSVHLSLYGVDIYTDKERFQRLCHQNKTINIFNILPYDDLKKIGDKFDVVVCNQVLEHVDDAQRLINIASNNLKINGFFIAGYPTSEIMIEPHLFLPLVHRINGRLPRKIAINIKFMTAKVFNIGRSSRLQWTERANFIQDRLTYMETQLFYRSKHEYDIMLSAIGVPINVSYSYINSSRSNTALDIIKSVLSLIPSKRLKNRISQSTFGVYTVTQKCAPQT